MRVSIFEKAEQLKPLVRLVDSTGEKLFFKFDVEDSPMVTLACNGKYTALESCSCRLHSIFGGVAKMTPLCAYVLAVYKWLPGDIKNEKQIRSGT